MRAQIELFSGNFRKSILHFDNARVADEFGNKISKTELGFYNEFFYWLNFLFCPEELNIKKLDTFIRKLEPIMHQPQKKRVLAVSARAYLCHGKIRDSC